MVSKSVEVLTALHAFCKQQGFDKSYIVALSGGLDSQVLLSALVALKQQFPFNLRVLHVNHGLHPDASAWQSSCQRLCASYQIEFTACIVQVVQRQGDSLEAAARTARYAAFAEQLGVDEILLTAHHQQDQAETFLLQALRGAGPKGMAGMPVIKPFAAGYLGRPLLAVDKASLLAYAAENHLVWIEDASNANVALSRNFLRHQILPPLSTHWPAATTTLARAAAHCAEVNALLEEYALADCIHAAGSVAGTVSVRRLLALSPLRQKQVLRQWIKANGYQLPDTRRLNTILRDVLTAAWDAMPCVQWGKVELRRYRDDLYLMHSQQEIRQAVSVSWDFAAPLPLPGVGELHALAVQGEGLRQDLQHVQVSLRQGGEMVRLARRGRRSLKQLFQMWGVPPWERSRVPMIFKDDQLISVLGYFIDEEYQAKAEELGWQILCHSSSANPAPV